MLRYVLNEAGDPVPEPDLMTWAQFMEQNDARRIARDEIGDVSVSTVFLGLDHSFTNGPPLLYETMVFGGPHDGCMDRYSTRDEAMAGHVRFVRAIQAGEEPTR